VNRPLRALVVDDEPLARARLRRLLGAEPDVTLAGECADGAEALRALASERPDLVLLDVEMPERGGFDVAAGATGPTAPAIVFVTAYPEYALRAFEARAIDYLVKPVGADRLREALERARRWLAGAARRPGPGRPAPPRADGRLALRVGHRVRLVDPDTIELCEAEGNYVNVRAGGASLLARTTLQALEARLDPRRFARVHRSVVVRLDRVEEVEPLGQGEYLLTLRGGACLTSGRTYRARLLAALGLRDGGDGDDPGPTD
jgi:two-component system LytT family response regulator